jgi:hypothetical protein
MIKQYTISGEFTLATLLAVAAYQSVAPATRSGCTKELRQMLVYLAGIGPDTPYRLVSRPVSIDPPHPCYFMHTI